MANLRPRVLIVDDDRLLCDLLNDYLEGEGFEIINSHDGESALEKLKNPASGIDLIVLDVLMPSLDGLTTLRRLRTITSTPVIMLSARGEPEDRALGLELGASDYLGKPFLPAELLARIRTQLRGPRMTPPKPIEVGELRLYPAQRRACIADRDLSLTAAEFSLLLALARTPKAVVCRNELTQAALGRQHEMYERCIDVHISRVRRKLAEASPTAPRIISIRGNGYLLQSCDTTDLACLSLTAHNA